MADLEIRDSDLVVIRIALRARDGGAPVTLNETVQVSELGLAAGGAAQVPVFDQEGYAKLMASGTNEGVEKALQMMADFNEATAEYVAGGGTPPAEKLANGIVDWVLATRPNGHTYTNDPNGEGYVLSAAEVNIHGPFDMDGERVWRVTAVGTWGQ